MVENSSFFLASHAAPLTLQIILAPLFGALREQGANAAWRIGQYRGWMQRGWEKVQACSTIKNKTEGGIPGLTHLVHILVQVLQDLARSVRDSSVLRLTAAKG